MAEDKGMESVDEGMAVVPDAPLADVPTIIPELEGTVSQLATDVSFARKTWKDGSSGGTPITAAELNRLEKGVGDLTNAVNALRDSVSHIDPGVHIRISPIGPRQTLHVNGSEWQTYLLFGSSSICVLIEHRGAGEPNVSKLSGSNITVKKGTDTSIDVSVDGMNGTIVVFSFRDFTLTRG